KESARLNVTVGLFENALQAGDIGSNQFQQRPLIALESASFQNIGACILPSLPDQDIQSIVDLGISVIPEHKGNKADKGRNPHEAYKADHQGCHGSTLRAGTPLVSQKCPFLEQVGRQFES